MGNGVAINLSVTTGTTVVSDFGSGTAYIRLPYVRKDATKTIAVYFIPEDGRAVRLPGATYDAAAGMLRFTTGHFSLYALVEESPMPFTDVAETDWFYDAVKKAVEKGWFTGTSDTTFSPNMPTTRGMIATVLWKMEGSPNISAVSAFDDVVAGQWYYDGVVWAEKNEIIGGYGNSNYGPNDNITREQMISILYKYATLKGYDRSKTSDLNEFTDANTISEYAKVAMAWAVESGLISGKGNGILDPKAGATRAEVATILTQFNDLTQ